MIFELQLFGGGGGKGGSESKSSYEMSPQEEKLADYAVDYATQASPMALDMMSKFKQLAGNNYGLQNVDYQKLVNGAMSNITNAQNLTNDLSQGQLPTAYLDNMSDAIKMGVNKTVGATVNDLGSRGVLNSSVTNKNLADIDTSTANAMAQSFNQNVSQLGGLAQQQAQMAMAPITAAAQGQQSALIAPNAALGYGTNIENTAVNQPLAAFRGSGTTTQSQSQEPDWLGTAFKIGSFFV